MQESPSGVRQRLGAWIESARVQQFIVWVILFNAVTLGLETSPWMHLKIGPLLRATEYAILTIFVLEIGIKLVAFGPRFFRSAWNAFDFLIVVISLVPAAGTLSVLRTLRILRALRLLKAIPRLRLIVEGVLRVLPDMGWVFTLLMLVFYIFSVIGTKLFSAAFPEYFGNLGLTMLTLFQVMTLESWASGVARPILAQFPYSWLYFVPFILFTTFLILNMVIGVVVNGFQAVLQGDEAPPGVPPHPLESHSRIDLLQQIEELNRKVDLLVEQKALTRDELAISELTTGEFTAGDSTPALK
jgi:voltage-gated sodium channel